MSSKLAHNLSSKIRTEDVLLPVGNNSDFKSMLLRPLILDGLTKAGFIQPSPIQLKAIPLARCGLDLIVQSKSGTGKTCVFTVAALELLNLDSLRLQALVVAPTREIALQIEYVIKEIGSQFSGLKVVPLIGGLPLQTDKERLKEGCHIVVGTPGRTLHCIELGLIELSAVRLFVLDEADMLMNLSFKHDINAIFKNLPASKQVVVCSATFTSELKSFLGKYMNNAPTYVTPSGECPVLLGLRHFVLLSPDQSSNQLRRLINKENQLMSILKSVPFSQCLVFSNYQTRAESICCNLRRKGWEKCCEWIAGSQDQGTRIGVYERVRDMKARILLTTDLTARGLDFEATNLVVNLDLPADPHTYLHRMGRAGRFGSQGIVITLLALDEMAKFRTLIGKIGPYANACIIPENVLNKELWTVNLEELEVLEGHSGSEEPEPEETPMSESEDVAENKTDSKDVVMIYSSNEEEKKEENIKTTELLEFGLKLLRFKKAPVFCSFKKLEESRRHFVRDAAANDSEKCKWKKVLEPAGSLDSDVAEYFISSYGRKMADVTKMCRHMYFVDVMKSLPCKSDSSFKFPNDSSIQGLNLEKLEISVERSNENRSSYSGDDVMNGLDSPKSGSSSRQSRSLSSHSVLFFEDTTGDTSNRIPDEDSKSTQYSNNDQNKIKKPVHIFVPKRKLCEVDSSSTSFEQVKDFRSNTPVHHQENNDFRYMCASNVQSTYEGNQDYRYTTDGFNKQSTSTVHYQVNQYPEYMDESIVQSCDYTPQQGKRIRQASNPCYNPAMNSYYHYNSNLHQSLHNSSMPLDQWNALYRQQLSQKRMYTSYSYYMHRMLHSLN